MGRLVFILRHRLPVIIFIIAALIGGVFIFWYLSNKEDSSNKEISRVQENISDTEGGDMEMSGEEVSTGYYGEPLSSSIPQGLRAVSLPISFFGDVQALREGDRIDIISVFYDPASNELYSGTILSRKEIIILESNENTPGQEYYRGASDSGYLSGGIFSDISSGSSNSSQLKKVIVITFYLAADEVERTFKAIEGGQLYLSICPADSKDLDINF